MKRLFLIDAYAMIYRAYYAFINNPRVNSKGLNTSAIFGFVNILEDILKREKPTHIAVAFDPSGPTFRHEAFEAYKAQRESTPEDIKRAVPYIKQIIEAYRIPIFEFPGFEADDVIGTLSKLAEKQGFDVFMVTPDKDYGQLVSEHVFMYRPRHTGGFEILGPKEVREKYEIESHEQVIDLLGLMGDKSDNIPGCPGVGEKTAVKLLQQFGSIDNMLNHTDEIKGALRTKIEENREQIVFSRFLATIKTDIPMELDEKQVVMEPVDEVAVRSVFEELEFRTLLNKVLPAAATVTDAPKAKPTPGLEQQTSLFDAFDQPSDVALAVETSQPAASTGTGFATINDVAHDYRLVDTDDKRTKLIAGLLTQKSVCFDTETTGVDVFSAELVGMSFCFRESEAFYVPLPADRAETDRILNIFRPFFQQKDIQKIGQNIKFDLLMLHQYGVALEGDLFDTMIAHYLIQPELRHGMDYLAEIYLNYKTIHYDDMVGQKGKGDIRKVEPQRICDYAAEDADVTFRLKQILEKELKENSLEKLFYEIEMPLMRVLAIMETNGVRIDTDALRQSSEILTGQMLDIEKEIFQLAGSEFNISSPVQVGDVLFGKLKLDEKAKKTKTGQYSTSEDVLEKLKSKHPVVGRILDYRGLKKLLSTYIDALPQLVNPRTGKVHTSYNQTVAATGRLSSTNPNLQNIPIRDAQGKEIRRAFIPDPEEVFMSADYSQVELRIMAHLSNDKNMIDAFLSGHDIHAATAANIYKIPIDEVTPDMRRKAKTANFGIIYGISVFGLSDRLGIPRAEAKELIDGYFATYPDVRNYMDQAIQGAKEKGYVETLLGRKRYLNDINSHNSIVRGYAERNAINAPIQGTAADIIKIAMIRIQKRIEEERLVSKMMLQVHDELNFTVPKHELETVKQLVVSEMESAIRLHVPLIADCGVGANWLEAH